MEKRKGTMKVSGLSEYGTYGFVSLVVLLEQERLQFPSSSIFKVVSSNCTNGWTFYDEADPATKKKKINN